MESIKEKIDYINKREKKVIQNFYSQKDFEDWHLSALSKLYSDLGYYYFIENDLSRARQSFSLVGYTDIYLTERYKKSHSRFLEFDIPRCLTTILSDNELLIQRYAKLRFRRGENGELSMEELISEGELAIWCNTIQLFMINDLKGLERNLNIIETKSLINLSKKEEGLKDDYEFYKALFTKNKNKIEEVLEKLVNPHIHLKRNDNPILNQYVSQPALGYAKLAWRHGLEVDINSQLIPKELLPVNPNVTYEIPYDFLKNIT